MLAKLCCSEGFRGLKIKILTYGSQHVCCPSVEWQNIGVSLFDEVRSDRFDRSDRH